MKLISLNVALFETNNEKLYQFLLDQEPDIVCLQEVALSIDPKVVKDYLSKDFIDKATKKLTHSFFSSTWLSKDFHLKNFHKKEDYFIDFGGWIESGIYVKSRFEMLKTANIFLKNNFGPMTEWTNWPENEVKSVQVVDLILSGNKKLRILNYHGIWTKEKIGNKETLKACKKINQLAREVNYPTIIAGDFNLFPDSESMKVFNKHFISLVDQHNIQTTRPESNELSHLKRNVIDFILISKGVKVNSFEVLDSDVSDHLPLILDFEL
ncbi:endonuclease/exonuclease/phosphatase family protein [Candidatus Daviesbacteria bacterium]|nr:endonuclease/exonuclease/phosphatase family protein [Candidatus Daviesbacteria bacterium]